MNILHESKVSLSWNNAGNFKSEIVNGIVTELHFCEPGCDGNSAGKCLTSVDYTFLKDVHAALGELFAQVEEQQKKLGYSFPLSEKEAVVNEPKDKID